MVELEISCFPIVDQDRPGLILPSSTNHPFPDKMVVVPAQFGIAMRGIGEDALGGCEAFTRVKPPLKVEIVQTGIQPQAARAELFGLDQPIAAVGKGEAVNLTLFLSSFSPGDYGEGIHFVGRDTPAAFKTGGAR